MQGGFYGLYKSVDAIGLFMRIDKLTYFKECKMSLPYIIAGLLGLLGFATGLVVVFWRRAYQQATLLAKHAQELSQALEHVARLEERARRIPRLEQDIVILTERYHEVQRVQAAKSAGAQEREQALSAQIAQLTQLRAQMNQDFSLLASQVLGVNEERFLRLANESFAKHQEGALAHFDKTQNALASLMAPMQETLAKYQQGLGELERLRSQEHGALKEQLNALASAQADVKAQASKLAQALRSNSQVRGAWGEQQLKNVLEMAGLSPYADYISQNSYEGEEGRLRPDVIIRLPGGRVLVVDAKTPLTAFLDAANADDETTRAQHLLRHVRALKAHINDLSSKKYWQHVGDTADYVVMFIPGEHFVAAALELDAELWVYAFDRKVMIATPTNLIALARTVAQIWRQEKLGETARQVAKLAQELYKRLSVMGDKVQSLGRNMERSVKSYNELIGSLENSVLPHARKFTELDVEGTTTPLDVLEPVESAVRLPNPNRDMQFAGELEARVVQAVNHADDG
jgi:DNA recombination protein RmuC